MLNYELTNRLEQFGKVSLTVRILSNGDELYRFEKGYNETFNSEQIDADISATIEALTAT